MLLNFGLAVCFLGRGMKRQPFSLPFVCCFLSWRGRGNLSLLDFPLHIDISMLLVILGMSLCKALNSMAVTGCFQFLTVFLLRRHC